MADPKDKRMSEELLHVPMQVKRDWVADLCNQRVRHESGFTMQFVFDNGCDLQGHVTAGYPALDGLDEGTRAMRVAWLHRMMTDGGQHFWSAWQANLH